MDWSPSASAREALAIAIRTGDLAGIELFFALPGAAEHVTQVNAYFASGGSLRMQPGEAPESVPGRSPVGEIANPEDLWFMDPRWELVLLDTIFFDQFEALQWFFASERVATIGATMAFFLPLLVEETAVSNHVDLLEVLLSSEVFHTHLSHRVKKHVLARGLFAALQRGQVDTIGLFVAHGAVLNYVQPGEFLGHEWSAANYTTVECVETQSQHGAFFVGANIDLKRLVDDGRYSAVAALFAQGVDVNATRFGIALHDSVRTASLKTVEQLLTLPPFFDVDWVNAHQQSALMKMWMDASRLSCEHDYPAQIAQLLLDHGANVNLRDNEGYTALHYACRMYMPDVVTVLLEYGADPHARSQWGEFPHDEVDVRRIQYEAFYKTLDLLLEQGVDPHAHNESSDSMHSRLLQSAEGRAFIGARPQYFTKSM